MSDPQFLSILGARIRELRIKKNMSQTDLAQLCNFEKATMSRIESGKTNVTVLTLKKISDVLRIDVHDFFMR